MPESQNKGPGNGKSVSRRSFLKTVGTGVVTTAVIPGVSVTCGGTAEVTTPREGVTSAAFELKVNGKKHRVNVESRATLAGVLRDELGLTGTKIGCNSGECGCCTALVDGDPVYSCMTLAMDAAGKDIKTIEGIGKNGKPSKLQESFVEHDAYQCGYCTPGHILTATAFIEKNSNPTLDEIKTGMSGNLCRCASYQNIFKAVAHAAGNGGR